MDRRGTMPAPFDDLTSDDALDAYPVRIRTLGRFSVQNHDAQSISRSRKTPHKPLELLKALIALGGRNVSHESLAHAIWPDADGDRALTVFDTTLLRLRRYLRAPGALVVSDRKLTLSTRHCWVDCWAVDRLMHRLDAILKADEPNQAEVETLSLRIERIYQGSFLGSDTPTAWSLSLRERLRSRYLRYITDTGRYWERAGQHVRAIECYRKGLESDNLMENFYRQLMHCHLQLGERAEALATYYRCERVLAKLLGIRPCLGTEALRNRAQTSR
jgi:two-component SAPR family response regulator